MQSVVHSRQAAEPPADRLSGFHRIEEAEPPPGATAALVKPRAQQLPSRMVVAPRAQIRRRLHYGAEEADFAAEDADIAEWEGQWRPCL